MAAQNSRITNFTATTTPNMVLPDNELRRGMRIQIYGPPDVQSGPTVWMKDDGTTAAPFTGLQMISGFLADWGELHPREFSRAQNLANCPTGPISVVTAAGSAQGMIEELM